MASHDYLSLEGGEYLVEFIVGNCAITDGEVEAYDAAMEKQKKKNKKKGGVEPCSPRQVARSVPVPCSRG